MNSPQLTYYDFGERVVAFSTTRHGGCSTGNYAAFNINAYCGDEAAHIAENRRSLASLLGIDERHIVMPHQVHGVEVRRIDCPQQEIIEGVDAVMTDVPRLCIGVSTADCIPILLYDEAHHAVCAVHAGWRGTVQRIARVAVEAMCKINLPMCNRLQLEEMGVTDIHLSGICTFQKHQDYFSARRLGINSGRIFTGIMLRS